MLKASLLSLFLFFSFNINAKIEKINKTSTPEIIVKGFLNNTLYDIENNKNYISKNPKYIKDIIKKNIIPYSDTQFASHYVLGKNIIDNKREDINLFSKSFESYFETIIFDFFYKFKDKNITVSNNNRFKNNKAFIEVKIEEDNPLLVDFVFLKKDNIWG